MFVHDNTRNNRVSANFDDKSVEYLSHFSLIKFNFFVTSKGKNSIAEQKLYLASFLRLLKCFEMFRNKTTKENLSTLPFSRNLRVLRDLGRHSADKRYPTLGI